MTAYDRLLIIAFVLACAFAEMLVVTGLHQAKTHHSGNVEVDMAVRSAGRDRAIFGKILFFAAIALFIVFGSIK